MPSDKQKPYVEGNTLYLSETYKFGSEEISKLVFPEKMRGRQLAKFPPKVGELGDYFPFICAATGVHEKVLLDFNVEDLMAAIEHASFLLPQRA